MVHSTVIAAGGGVRFGLEDNTWFDPERTKRARNTDLIRRIQNPAEANGRACYEASVAKKIAFYYPVTGMTGFLNLVSEGLL